MFEPDAARWTGTAGNAKKLPSPTSAVAYEQSANLKKPFWNLYTIAKYLELSKEKFFFQLLRPYSVIYC